MSDYPRIVTVLDRLLNLGLPRHAAIRHLRYGRVSVAGEVVTDPYRPAWPPTPVVLRTTSTTEEAA